MGFLQSSAIDISLSLNLAAHNGDAWGLIIARLRHKIGFQIFTFSLDEDGQCTDGPDFISDLIKLFCVLDLVGLFRTFFGVEVAFALDPDLDTEHVFLTEIVRLARRLLFL